MRRSHTCMILVALLLGTFLGMVPEPVAAAIDDVTIWRSDFSSEAAVFNESAMVGIRATDGGTSGGTSWANVSDPSDPGDHINVTLYDDGTHNDQTPNDGIYTGTFTVKDDLGSSGSATNNATDTIDIHEGTEAMVAVDLDGDGNGSAKPVLTDFTPPLISIQTQSGGYYNDFMYLNATIDDANLNQSSVGYLVDGANFTPMSLAPPSDGSRAGVTFFAKIDTKLLMEDKHTLAVQAKDNAGNFRDENHMDFNVDRTALEMEIPFEGGYVSGTITITVTIIIYGEGESPVVASSVTYTIDFGTPVPFTQLSETTFQAVIITDLLSEGPHTLVVNSMDGAGNAGEQSWDLIVDNNVPNIAFGTLTKDEFGNAVFDATITDTYLNEGTIMANANDGTWVPPTSQEGSKYTWKINYTEYGPGKHRISITAKDEANNTMTLHIEFEVTQRPGPCEDCTVTVQTNGDVKLDWKDPEPPADLFEIYSSDKALSISDLTSMQPTDTTQISVYTFSPFSKTIKYVAIFPKKGNLYGEPCIIEIKYPESTYEEITVGKPDIPTKKPKKGQTHEIETTITNGEDIPVTVEVEILVGGQSVGKETVTIDGQSSETVTIPWIPTASGPQDIEVIVSKPTVPPEEVGRNQETVTIAPETEPDTPIGWPENPLKDSGIPYVSGLGSECCPLGLLALALLIGGLAAIVYSRKKKVRVPHDTRPSYPTKPTERHYPKAPPTEQPPSAPQTDLTQAPADVVSEAGPPATPVTTPVTTPVSRPETPPETPPTTVTETAPPVHVETPPTTPETPPKTVERLPTTTSSVPRSAPTVIPASTVFTYRKGDPCDGVKEAWDAKKANAEKARKEAEAAQANVKAKRTDAQQKRKEADEARKEATEARKEANDKKKPMEEKLKKLEDRLKQRDQMFDTILNTVDGASRTPQEGWEDHHGAEDGRSGLYPGRVYFKPPADSSVKDFNDTMEKWKDELKKAKEREDEARKEFEEAKKEYDDADREANKKEGDADTKEAATNKAKSDYEQAVKDEEAKRNVANGAIEEANRFADLWRQCIKDRLDRLADRVGSYAEEAEAASKRARQGTTPADREQAAQDAAEAKQKAQDSNDTLEREISEIDDPELQKDKGAADRKGDGYERKASRAASQARYYSSKLPRQCQDGEHSSKPFTRRRMELDESRDVEIKYDPTYGADIDGGISGEEAAEAMAELFGQIKEGLDKGSDYIPKGGEIVSVPIDFFKFYMDAGSAALREVTKKLKEHYNKYGFGTLTIKIPMLRYTEHWEKRFVCENGMWVLEEKVKVSEESTPEWRTIRRLNVELKDVPGEVATFVNRYRK